MTPIMVIEFAELTAAKVYNQNALPNYENYSFFAQSKGNDMERLAR